MLFSSTFVATLSLLLIGAIAGPCKRNCKTDVCYIAAASGAGSPQQATADCSFHVGTTVTVAPTTTTVTVTYDAYYTPPSSEATSNGFTFTGAPTAAPPTPADSGNFAGSTLTDYHEDYFSHAGAPKPSCTTRPPYLAPCPGPDAYSSACSCLGIRKFTVTQTAAVATSTSTAWV